MANKLLITAALSLGFAVLLTGVSSYPCILLAVTSLGLAIAAFYPWTPFDLKSLKEKRVLVTGASSGIGEQIAYYYSKHGAALVIVARRRELLEKVATKCKTLGAKQVEYLVADMGSSEDRELLVKETEKHLGGLDHLILNHFSTTPGLWKGTQEDVTRLRIELEVNFVSYVDIASRALPMLKKSHGNIGVVSSVAGKTTVPGLSSYVADKFALQGFFATLRQELKVSNTGVSVTLCVLSYTATEMAIKCINELYKGVQKPASVDGAAVAIVRGVTDRSYEIYYPFLAWVLTTAQKIFSGYFENYSGKSLVEFQ